MSAMKTWIRALNLTKASSHLTLPTIIEQLADDYGDRPALMDSAECLTYRALADRMKHYARWAMDQGLTGTVVGLLMPNCPDYVAIWLGLTRVGCTVALVNTNLRGEALFHSVTSVKATHLVVSAEFFVLFENQHCGLSRIWKWPFASLPSASQGAMPSVEHPLPRPDNRALLIYTSGTTGLPKAVNITHRRIVEWCFWFAGMMNVQPDDRLYNCLPMYHSIGGVVAIGSMLVKGGSVVIRLRFSATHFWQEICDNQCTIFQYIGELCRYLTNSPPQPRERMHRLRLACGNGLQPDVWKAFQDRFHIAQILEFYAATEGNVSLYNIEGEPGSIGRIPPVLEPYFAVKLIRVDPETGEPIRDASGLCIECDPDESGEAVGRIQQNRSFDGYNDVAATQRKILQNVFISGDRWFRTGDLMRKNSAGFYFFEDRLGDTFRWKGENVSTTEVAIVLRRCDGVTDAVVYGVRMAGTEGRAGMAAITTNEDFNFEKLTEQLEQQLPAYARPLFVRICASLAVTGTFKLTRVPLAAEGYAAAKDPVWMFDQKMNQFTPYTQA